MGQSFVYICLCGEEEIASYVSPNSFVREAFPSYENEKFYHGCVSEHSFLFGSLHRVLTHASSVHCLAAQTTFIYVVIIFETRYGLLVSVCQPDTNSGHLGRGELLLEELPP